MCNYTHIYLVSFGLKYICLGLWKMILHFWKHFTTSFNSVVNALSNEVCIVDKTWGKISVLNGEVGHDLIFYLVGYHRKYCIWESIQVNRHCIIAVVTPKLNHCIIHTKLNYLLFSIWIYWKLPCRVVSKMMCNGYQKIVISCTDILCICNRAKSVTSHNSSFFHGSCWNQSAACKVAHCLLGLDATREVMYS